MRRILFTLRWLLLIALLSGGIHEATAQQASGKSDSRYMSLKPPSDATKELAPPRLHIQSLCFEEPSGNNVLDADETGSIYLEVFNDGQGQGGKLAVTLMPVDQDQGLVYEQRTDVDNVEPGQTRVFTVPLRADRSVSQGAVTFQVQVREEQGFDSDPLRLTFETQAFRAPALSIEEPLVINDSEEGLAYGNNNGRLELGESAEVTAVVQNRGPGVAEAVVLSVLDLPQQNVFYASAEHSFELGDIEPGTWKEVTFAITLNKRYQGDVIPVRLVVVERTGDFGAELSTAIPLNQHPSNIDVVVIEGKNVPREVSTELPSLELGIDVDVNVPETTMDNADAVAVIIGNRRYQDEQVPAVEFALRGAETIRQYLIHGLGFRPENIIFEEDATKSKFESIFGTSADAKGRLYSYIRPDKSDVFIYYHGHGAPDVVNHKAYLVPVDADPDYIRFNGYPLDLLYANIGKLPARTVTLVMDACFSGSSEEGTLVQSASPALLRVESPVMAAKNTMLFAASQSDQVSSWYTEKKHGLLTYFFLRGLQGEADGNHDGSVTAGEMSDYLAENVTFMAGRLYNRKQQPQVLGTDQDRVLIQFDR